jgi:hypothetical protein
MQNYNALDITEAQYRFLKGLGIDPFDKARATDALAGFTKHGRAKRHARNARSKRIERRKMARRSRRKNRR